MRKIILTLLVMTSCALAANPFREFSGLYHISSAPISDPPEKLPPNTHVYFSIKGQPAQEMYDLIEGEPKLNHCGLAHYVKSTGNIDCSFYPIKTEYSCDFSINIKEGVVDSGGWC